jgi:hypothetical protein
MTLKLKSTASYRAIHTEGLEEEEIREHEYLYQYSEFDENGNILLEETHLQGGTIEHKANYRYDGEGRMVEELLLEEDDFISEHRTMEFDEKGRLWKEQMHYLDDSYDETVYQYDDDGRLLQKETADDEGESGNKIKVDYKGKNPVSEIEYDPEGVIISEKHFEYDDNGRLISESVESKDEDFKLTHEYDEKGDRSVTRKYNSQGQLIERSNYSRDEKGRTIQVKEESVTGIEILNIQYDEQGNMVLQDTVTDKEEPVSRIERSYDENGQLLVTHVHMEGRGQRPPQDYRIRFEYSYH